MSSTPQMRSGLDRLRHALLFEIVLLILTVVILTGLLNQSSTHMGAFGIILAVMAMVWNFVFNWAFDHTLVFLGHPLYPRSFGLRATHALAFELGLMVASVPFTMFWLNYTFFQALTLDIAFVLSVPVYAIIFNYGYDTLFPAPGTRS